MTAEIKQILISYRPGDTEEIYGRMYDSLRVQFGASTVAPSGASSRSGLITPGSIEEMLEHCAVLVVLAGPRWLQAGSPGSPWAENPQDPTRLEIVSALQRQIPVLLVLTQGASTPSADQVPPDMLPLLGQSRLLLRDDPDFRADMQSLVARLQQTVRILPLDLQQGASISGHPIWNATLTFLGGLVLCDVVVAALALGVGLATGLITVGQKSPLSAEQKQAQTTFTVVLFIVVAGLYLVAVFLAGRRASFRTGRIASGNLAGLLFGLITSAMLLLYLAVSIIQVNNSTQSPIEQGFSEAIGVLIVGVLAIVDILVCSVLGLLGGLLGSWQRNARIKALQHSPVVSMTQGG
jgi:hypothetical protein